MSSEAYRTMYRMLDMARMDARREGRDAGIEWQKEQSQEIIDRMASDMKRMNSDNERLIAEIEALKAASSRPSAR